MKFEIVVFSPRDRRVVPMPDLTNVDCLTAAVSCAADSCDDGRHVSASLYSSETGVWSATVTLGSDCECYVQYVKDELGDNLDLFPYVKPMRAAVIGDETYCTLEPPCQV